MSAYSLGIPQLAAQVKILPISGLYIEFDDGDTWQLDLLESDSSLSVQGIGEMTDLGVERMTAVIIQGSAVIMHNTYSDDELRILMRRLMREQETLVDLRADLKALSGQEAGAQMKVGVDAAESTVRSIGLPPWSVEWIPTERPRLKLQWTIICSIDVLDDFDDAGTLRSRLFHHIGF